LNRRTTYRISEAVPQRASPRTLGFGRWGDLIVHNRENRGSRSATGLRAKLLEIAWFLGVGEETVSGR
jgi:hypothetical protein